MEDEKLRVEEIALRQEIRQMLNEAGINKNTLQEMAKEVMQEEIAKQVKTALSGSNINRIVCSKINTYEFRDALREGIKKEVSEMVNINIEVKVHEKVNS